jgi:hypothetical protein
MLPPIRKKLPAPYYKAQAAIKLGVTKRSHNHTTFWRPGRVQHRTARRRTPSERMADTDLVTGARSISISHRQTVTHGKGFTAVLVLDAGHIAV